MSTTIYRNSVNLRICRLPDGQVLTEDDITLTFDTAGKDASCNWEDDVLTVTCEKGAVCTVTISDGTSTTTFTVSNPSAAKLTYLQALRFADRTVRNLRSLYFIATELLDYLFEIVSSKLF